MDSPGRNKGRQCLRFARNASSDAPKEKVEVGDAVAGSAGVGRSLGAGGGRERERGRAMACVQWRSQEGKIKRRDSPRAFREPSKVQTAAF